MTKPPIEFYFDFVSVFGYLASQRIEAIAARHARKVEWRSILLGVTVMNIMGLKPLLETPLKSDYVRNEAARHARRYGLPLVMPEGSDLVNPLPPARSFQWVKSHHPLKAKEFARELLFAYWGQGKDVSQRDVIAETAERLGLDGDQVATAAEGQEAKDLLKREVDAAIKVGVFGSPFFMIDGEPFWGVDNLDLADAWLEKGGW